MFLKSTFPQKVFTSQIPDVILSAACSRVHVTIFFANSNIYEENLIPDSNNNVAIRDISNLVMPFARRALVAQLDVRLIAQNITTTESGEQHIVNVAESSLTTSVVYSTAEVSDDATTFCENHFLTRLQGTKITAPHRLEYLHYDSTEVPSVTATYTDSSKAVFTPPIVGGNDGYSTIDVSPLLFVSEGKILTSYTVTAGNRTQIFDIDFSAADAAPILLFTNCFGCQETVYCCGTHKVAPKFKYEKTFVNGSYKTISVDEVREFNADTGVLTFEMADWLSDLFRSDEIYLLNFFDGEPKVGREIVMSDSPKTEYSNDDDELPRFSFTYRYAKRNQNFIDTGRGGRVFDNTFDFTFE